MAPKNLNRSLRIGTGFLAMAAAFAASAQTSQPIDLSKGHTLYVVPYAHLDTQWRWAYPQTIREYIKNTLTRNFALIDRYPHYIFNFSGSRRYEMMKEYYPDLYQKLIGYVKEGRWFPCGSSVDEDDANVPSGESIIRHILYGNHYFRREFGVASEEFMLPDCFGFPYSLPSILAHCGIKGFSTQKLTWGSAVGIPFKVGVWEGPDGKSVVAALDPGSYGGPVSEDLSQNTSWLARIQKTGDISGAYVDYHYYGTGDQGGAPNARSVDWMEKSVEGTGPVTVVSAKADDMFKALKPNQIAKMPRYKGELLLTAHSAGSISSEAFMKRSNRKSELLADAAEKASLAANLVGNTTYPSDRLYRAWDLVLGSQMHDMLPGTSIPKAYEFCWNDFLLAQNQFASIETDAVGAVAARLDTRGKGTPLIVYNPLSTARRDLVEATIPDSFRGGSVAVSGPNGKDETGQILARKDGMVTVAFQAEAPATGFAVYSVHAAAHPAPVKSDLKIDARHIENSRYRVTVNEAGDIASIVDKQTKREILKAPSRLEMQYENPSAYPAWNMDWDDAKLPPRDIVGGPAKFRIVERGPTRVVLEVERRAKGSKFVQDIRLTSGGDQVEVLNKIDWATRERALKASFPLTCGNPEATYDLQLGATRRGNNDPKKYEVPQHQWFDLTNTAGTYGVGILNDSKFASDKPNDDTVRLTLLYTPGVRGGTEDQATQDFGRHEILYAIAPHRGDWRVGQVPWKGKRLNQPLRAFVVTPHAGTLGKSFSLGSTSSNDVEIQALKKAEDSDEIVVRFREINGFGAKGVRVKFAQPVVSAREVNGQEMPIGPATISGGELVADVPAYSLKTYAIRLAKTKSEASVPPIVAQTLKLPFNADVVSTIAHPGDGEFVNHQSLAADQLPSTLTVDGVKFALGPKNDGAENAVAAHGQKISLPKGFNRLYLVAAADSDTAATFKLGKFSAPLVVQDWTGYVGQWDNRTWSVNPGPNFNNYGDNMNGLVPGYVKHGEVAWFASHDHTPTGNTYYQYTYLYKYGIDIPKGVTSVTFPNDAHVKILAASVARNTHDRIAPVQALCDTLADHSGGGAPSVTPNSGTFTDSTEVRIDPPLYWHGGTIHYTTDGSTPTASSPTYKGPFMVSNPTTVLTVHVDVDGKTSTVGGATLMVNDTTPPSIVAASIAKELGFAKVVFSEPLDKASAETVANYRLDSNAEIASAELGPDQRTVELTLAHPTASLEPDRLSVSGVKDRASTPNVAKASVDLKVHGAVFTSPALAPQESRVFSRIQGMPVHGGDSWTLNLFCKIDAQPEDRVMIAGFGRSIDGQTGAGRYFTKFARGINFWVTGRDVATDVPLDLGKWQMLTATYDGTTMRLFKNGEKIAEETVQLENDSSQVRVMPLDAWERERRFGGEVRDLTVWDMDLPPAAVKRMWEAGRDK
ncbi:MAG: glycoside hydrolase family 38 C-terminal domain-containing protein [Fimbriimonas sp.]|nr:glycoside hydrolase family 38 C-terminal domain-containing protein [Fimbriimonas sp.]